MLSLLSTFGSKSQLNPIPSPYKALHNSKKPLLKQKELFNPYKNWKLIILLLLILSQGGLNYFMFQLTSPKKFQESKKLQYIADLLSNKETARIDIYASLFMIIVVIIVIYNIILSNLKYDSIENNTYLWKLQQNSFFRPGKYIDRAGIISTTENVIKNFLELTSSIMSIFIPIIIMLSNQDERKIGWILLAILSVYLILSYVACIIIGIKGMKFGIFMSQQVPKSNAIQDSYLVYRRTNRCDEYHHKLADLKRVEADKLNSFTNIFTYILLGISLCLGITLIIIARSDVTAAFGVMTFAYQMFQIPYKMNEVFSNYFQGKGFIDSFNKAFYPKPQGKIVINKINTIEYKDLNFTRNGKDIFKGYSQKIDPKKKFYLIMGPSGSGKSTLVKLLAQEQVASDGDTYMPTNLYINGVPIDDINSTAFNKKVLYITQDVISSNVFPVRDMFKASSPNITDEEIAEYLLLFGLDNRIKNYDEIPHGLSGGEKHRLFIACMLATNPNAELIILDEVTAALSESMALLIIDNIKAKNPNALILCVTHLNALAKDNPNIIQLTDQGFTDSEE